MLVLMLQLGWCCCWHLLTKALSYVLIVGIRVCYGIGASIWDGVRPGANAIKLLPPQFTNFAISKCLSMASFTNIG
jgi:hypothetical protein